MYDIRYPYKQVPPFPPAHLLQLRSSSSHQELDNHPSLNIDQALEHHSIVSIHGLTHTIKVLGFIDTQHQKFYSYPLHQPKDPEHRLLLDPSIVFQDVKLLQHHQVSQVDLLPKDQVIITESD